MVMYPMASAWTFPDTIIATDMINESSESTQLPVTVTICICVNIYCCKPYISLCYSFLAIQVYNSLLSGAQYFWDHARHS